MSIDLTTPRNFDQANVRGEEESLFSRDDDSGQLIRATPATREDLDRDVNIKIDGREFTVKKAQILRDEQGNPRRDENDQVIPRPTTIYDAVSLLYQDQLRQENPIPILCHREYMEPVGVCRVCVVQIAKFKARTGKVEVERKLMPSCQHRVEDQMIVDTVASPDDKARKRIESSVGVLTSLLMADHPSPCVKEKEDGSCELEALSRRMAANTIDLQPWKPRAISPDSSSLLISIDHNACILCDRCIRGCNSIRDNQILGRMNKGASTQIGFDLSLPMGESECVSCGECMVSCPTGALTHKAKVQTDLTRQGKPVSAQELLEHPLPEIRNAFRGVSRPFLEWNENSIVRRSYRKGDIICREGEFGSTAFLIEKGSVEIFINSTLTQVTTQPKYGAFGWFSGITSLIAGKEQERQVKPGDPDHITIDAPVSLPLSNPRATLYQGDLFGEMTCMNSYPRSATVRAAEDCTVLEMLKNVLYILQRSRSFRNVLEGKYRTRLIDNHLRTVPLLAPARVDEARFEQLYTSLRDKVDFQRYEPGQVILRQGAATDDGLYLIRTGFVSVSQASPGGDRVMSYVGPGGYIGEIGLMAGFPELKDLGLAPRRTATCTALDHVTVVVISSADFLEVMQQFPELRAPLVEEARRRMGESAAAMRKADQVPLGDFLEQGLQEAQNLLVLDLEKCTRCDECTKACSDTHAGVTRLVREGLRFDRFLVASACRSCLDPYCMVGCPVGSIQRGSTGEIVIKDWCVGCGQCSNNCPYGNISMVELAEERRVAERKATTCDLCHSLGPNSEPSCVYACPHDAAHRMTGKKLISLVELAQSKGL